VCEPTVSLCQAMQLVVTVARRLKCGAIFSEHGPMANILFGVLVENLKQSIFHTVIHRES